MPISFLIIYCFDSFELSVILNQLFVKITQLSAISIKTSAEQIFIWVIILMKEARESQRVRNKHRFICQSISFPILMLGRDRFTINILILIIMFDNLNYSLQFHSLTKQVLQTLELGLSLRIL